MKYHKYRKEVIQSLRSKGLNFKDADSSDVETMEQCIRDYYDENCDTRSAANNLYMDMTFDITVGI